ncbi:LSM11_C domain-containing protein [Naegleria gruberi]|uniref:LSM11_C domain-containing protein n=1 Tax=Naegleria gruberi TaxID=5762 RepID=D2VDP4_NAEGR|nr:LSM11_C domain-containing protein [Naegleria gruberi]EFC45037.1 LSM11_C domain-containing protein [Naegleria gruberi]|eukprot:XP_002677781.1 LSM11_C domain-containing protein [Naegleria gruberi strain NEG-M]
MSERKNVFLREDFDPLIALFGSVDKNNNNNSVTDADDDVMIPPISNIKPYKTFDAINLDQLLLKNKPKQQKQKQQINKEEKKESCVVVDRDDQIVAAGSSSSSSLSSSEQKQSSDESIVKSNLPDVKDLPTLAHKDTYRGFLEHKYGQASVSSSQHSFGLLYQAVMEKKRVGVMVKTRHGHSKLEGVLSGFDKFFNMILLDVKENYKELEIRFKKQKTLDRERGIMIPSTTTTTTTTKKKNSRNRKRRVRCLVEKEREFPLLFVKGCQVISVMSIPGK